MTLSATPSEIPQCPPLAQEDIERFRAWFFEGPEIDYTEEDLDGLIAWHEECMAMLRCAALPEKGRLAWKEALGAVKHHIVAWWNAAPRDDRLMGYSRDFPPERCNEATAWKMPLSEWMQGRFLMPDVYTEIVLGECDAQTLWAVEDANGICRSVVFARPCGTDSQWEVTLCVRKDGRPVAAIHLAKWFGIWTVKNLASRDSAVTGWLWNNARAFATADTGQRFLEPQVALSWASAKARHKQSVELAWRMKAFSTRSKLGRQHLADYPHLKTLR